MTRPTTVRRVLGGYLLIGGIGAPVVLLVWIVTGSSEWWPLAALSAGHLIAGTILVLLPDSPVGKTMSQRRRDPGQPPNPRLQTDRATPGR